MYIVLVKFNVTKGGGILEASVSYASNLHHSHMNSRCSVIVHSFCSVV